jgi:putative ABC transport system ATP-binding protein
MSAADVDGGVTGLPRAAGSDSALRVVRRALALAPEFTAGLPLTLLFALLATAGRVVIPIAVQQTLDHGIRAAGGPNQGLVAVLVGVSAVAVGLTAVFAYLLNVRLYRTSERGLAALRVRAFRHVHELAVLDQATERRGSLVSRVTSDVDTVTTFMQQGGLVFVMSLGQVLVATVIMAVYSPPLTALVWVCFLPLFLLLRTFQRRVSAAYGAVRRRVGEMLAMIAESVVGAAVIRAYAIEEHTANRIETSVGRTASAQVRAQRLVAMTFSVGEVAAGLANAGVVVLGVLLGVAGHITVGELVAFLFLVGLFVAPVQVGVEVLNDAQNAIAGWRRVLEVLDVPVTVADPGPAGRELPRGPAEVEFTGVAFAYPDGPEVLTDVTVRIAAGARVAVVGETGSGKTTFARLLTRLMDPSRGQVRLDGVPLPEVRFDSLRARVVMVPQDGFLFDTTVLDNIRYGRPEASEDVVERAMADLGLADWLAGLPAGLRTRVGQRGESLSAGERQLVALVRAYIADPDLLVLDEATSAVDPATETRLQRALDGLTRGRTAVTIAHRLSTAEAADEVLVFDAGRLVARGGHADLLAAGGVYGRLHASWAARREAKTR